MRWLTTILMFLAAHAAAEVSIFSVNKTLSMGPKDTVYRDYYLNGGTEDGFRRGMLVTVVRRVPVHDLSRNRALGDLRVPVAKLKLVYVNHNISVGRVDKLIRPVNLPATEFAAVMVGDTVVLGNGMDDLGKMDDLDGAAEKGESPDGGIAPDVASAEPTPTAPAPTVSVPTASAPIAAPDPAAPATAVTVLPEKNAPLAETQTAQAAPEKTKKLSPKARRAEKKPLKTPRKPDNSTENAVLGPAA
jgi:hypothetical protein